MWSDAKYDHADISQINSVENYTVLLVTSIRAIKLCHYIDLYIILARLIC